MARFELTDEQWDRIKLLLPGKIGDVGATATDNRQFVNAVLWIDRTGAPWRDMPERYGNWHSVYVRYKRWCDKGVWETVFLSLSQKDPDFDYVMIDSTTVRAHQHAAGAKGGKSISC